MIEANRIEVLNFPVNVITNNSYGTNVVATSEHFELLHFIEKSPYKMLMIYSLNFKLLNRTWDNK